MVPVLMDMMKSKNLEIYILTEGGREHGCGHIVRCSALYEAFVSIGTNVNLIINGDDSCKNKLGTYINWIDQVVIQHECSDNVVLIMDSYNASRKTIELYNKSYSNIALIDDTLSIDVNHGVVINPTNFFEYIAHKCNPNINYIKGRDLILLRKEFWEVPRYFVRDKIDNITITMGANDLRRISFKLASFLNSNFNIRNISIVRNDETISSTDAHSNSKNVCIRKNLSAIEMRDLMCQSDLVISGGGQTLYELARIGVPAIAVCLIENQAAAIKAFIDDEFILQFIQWDDQDLMEKVRKSYLFYSEKDTRKRASMAGNRCVDGMGAIRLANRIMEYYNA